MFVPDPRLFYSAVLQEALLDNEQHIETAQSVLGSIEKEANYRTTP